MSISQAVYDGLIAKIADDEAEIERLLGLIEFAGRCLVHGNVQAALEHLRAAKDYAPGQPTGGNNE